MRNINVTITLSLKELDERIAKAIAPLKEEVRLLKPLKEEVRLLKNKLAKLEYSLVYRDMAARVTSANKHRQTAKDSNPVLRSYLSAPQGRNSKLDVVKRELHAVAHANKKGDRRYKRDERDIRKMSKAVYTSKQKRKPGWVPLTEESKKAHNKRWEAEFYKSRPKPVSSASKRSGTTPSVGSLGRSTVFKTIGPMHDVLKQNPDWHANFRRAGSV